MTDCGYPEQPPGVVVILEDGLAHYSCKEGHLLHGEDTRYCQQDGVWNGAPPVCAGKFAE